MPRRLTSLVALAACLLAQLAGSVHTAAVAHVACAEHGGVVELRADPHTAGPAAGHATITSSAEDAHHDHCAGCATPTGTASTSAPQAASAAEFARSHPGPNAQCPVPDALFRLAPKGSPPASRSV